ncbi:MAG: terminase small subunit [Planctomycetota bacterium]
MPRVITQEKAENIAKCLFEENWNYYRGLVKAGYSKSYARTGEGCKTCANPLVKAEIDKIKADIEDKFELTKENIMRNFLEDRRLAKENNNTGNMIRADENLGRMGGAFNDDLSGGLNILDIIARVGINVEKASERPVEGKTE